MFWRKGILFLVATAFLGADVKKESLQEQIDEQRAKNAVKDYGATLRATRPDDGHGFYITLAYLYWQAFVAGTEYANKYDPDFNAIAPGVLLLPGGDAERLSFGGDSGIRGGLGYTLPYDGWDICLVYTWFRTTESDAVNPSGGLFPLQSYKAAAGASSVERASMDYEIRFQTLDFELGRGTFLSRTLAVRPHLGARGTFINQESKIEYLDYEITGDNDFAAGGLRLGMDSQWFMGYGFHILADLSASLLWGKFDVESKHENGDVTLLRLKDDHARMVASVDLQAGLGWQIWFNKDRNQFRLSFAYEMQYWWDQNQLEYYPSASIANYVRVGHDLGFHGLTIKGRMDF